MGQQVCTGALTKCTFGMMPSALMVLPISRTMTGAPAANIMDNKPMVNVLPFGMCQSMANPMVAAASAAAMGALVPMPCIPMTMAPWLPGSPKVLIGNLPALNNSSKLMCMWGGVIGINMAGQFTVMVP
ncbi:DUF4280 domain-containing protein [Derxia lacustris]|uniref:DUF4280 domain-containing protein n=1 Tax=Derxia lacustris TaxID=764842 RepID=UPI000A176A67|nr:DUF4280 domain-containing protein [Derxia lacustris]